MRQSIEEDNEEQEEKKKKEDQGVKAKEVIQLVISRQKMKNNYTRIIKKKKDHRVTSTHAGNEDRRVFKGT